MENGVMKKESAMPSLSTALVCQKSAPDMSEAFSSSVIFDMSRAYFMLLPSRKICRTVLILL